MDCEERLKEIQLLVLDVDGTLTDGGMYYSAEGDVLKRFYVQDGMGITLLQRAGIKIALLTSESSPIVKARALKLKIEHVILGCKAKRQALLDLAQKLEIPLHRIAYMGDDVNDEAPMQIAGIAACPSDAVSVIQKVADYICQAQGGKGAVREFAEKILEAQGKSNTLPEVWGDLAAELTQKGSG
jgi:YrbI family 3-deoxy-D-manno-octulosonate 8-phosphate phosphatase